MSNLLKPRKLVFKLRVILSYSVTLRLSRPLSCLSVCDPHFMMAKLAFQVLALLLCSLQLRLYCRCCSCVHCELVWVVAVSILGRYHTRLACNSIIFTYRCAS